MDKVVYDSLNNEYERKNLYFKDLSESKNVNEKNHPYMIKLEKNLKIEKDFLNELKKELKLKKEEYSNFDRKTINLKLELFEAIKKTDFYKEIEDISYDFELEYKVNKLKVERLPEIIKLYQDSIDEMKELKISFNKLSKEENLIKVKEFELKKAELKSQFQKDVDKLKKSNSEGLISKKALKDETHQLKMKLSDELEVLKLDIPKENIKSKINVLKYVSKSLVDSKYKIMNQDISDLYRKIPVEVKKRSSVYEYISLIIPGISQYKNKQYFKAILFFIGALFTYFIAIPYALGFGNYRGQGIYGLYTLAQGAKKLDTSIIFMIEGLVAILLLLYSIAISVISYKDGKDVRNNMYRGIRPMTKFETIETVKEDGFPYIVSISTFILLSFVVILPIFTTILLSFAGMDPQNQLKFKWVGFANYKLLITGTGIAGGPFWLITGWTLVWTLLSTTSAIFVGFSLALIANNERIIGKKLYRTIYLLPWAVPAFITIMFFSIMSSSNGLLTNLMQNITGIDYGIKESPNITRMALIFLQTWLGSSYVFLLSTGVLQGIPSDLYEAADIDGATVWQKLSRITVPLVLFQTAPLLIGQYTFNFNNFSIIYLFNGGGPSNPILYGNSAGSTDLLISYIYKLTIEQKYQSVGAAITVFVSFGLIFVAYLGFSRSKAFREDK